MLVLELTILEYDHQRIGGSVRQILKEKKTKQEKQQYTGKKSSFGKYDDQGCYFLLATNTLQHPDL